MDHARTVLDYWFGPQSLDAARLAERMRFWFGGAESPAMLHMRDRDIAARFGPLMRRAAAGECSSWADSARRRLALILLLDQFPRRVYRGRPEAYATDGLALQLALDGLHAAADATLTPAERIFFYMPLQHAEALDAQDESVAAYRRLCGEAPPEMRHAFVTLLRFAQLHRDIIARFGRFPHRNKVLRRDSTPDELSYLRANVPRFGQ
ncbi:MAG: DUF924 domain-containing protein [Steroidobacteraceae bacterium]|nr:DUF924 domain-containing protein [Steroidobacteraceae bacterium]MDW8259464.1 DUF924 family protein [Gammaproteobacteria bacterium]